MNTTIQSIAALSENIRSRRITSEAVTLDTLDRISRFDGSLHSFFAVDAEGAIAAAKACDKEIASGFYRGRLHGVPLAVKDVCYTRTLPTTGGMAKYRAFRPGYDATVVRRLTDAGAVMLGKLAMTEDALFLHHPSFPVPVNPWRTDLWAGASSSGSGVATAAGLCYASLGSDTGGSIRVPAACNNLTGLKPTWGLVSRYGTVECTGERDTIGPLARSAEDIAIVLSAIGGHDPHDPTSAKTPALDYTRALVGLDDLVGKRIGVDWQFNAQGAGAEHLAFLKRAAQELQSAGAEIVPIEFPDQNDALVLGGRIIAARVAAIHGDDYRVDPRGAGPDLAATIEAGWSLSPAELNEASLVCQDFRARMLGSLQGIDAILTAVLPHATPTIAEFEALVANDVPALLRFTTTINIAGVPAIVFPVGMTGDGRPVGVQLVGAPFSEAVLLQLAHIYQRHTSWHLARASLSADSERKGELSKGRIADASR